MLQWTISARTCPGVEIQSFFGEQKQRSLSNAARREALDRNTRAPIARPIPVSTRFQPTLEQPQSCHAISLDKDGSFDEPMLAQTAIAVKIYQWRPQATQAKAVAETSKAYDQQRPRSRQVNILDNSHTTDSSHFDVAAEQLSDSVASWVSESTISESSSFASSELTTSSSTATSTHEIVKGFTPGAPSMYRSHSNLSQLRRITTPSRSNTPPVRSSSRRSSATALDGEIHSECPIDEEYEDDYSLTDCDNCSNGSGLTMVRSFQRAIVTLGDANQISAFWTIQNGETSIDYSPSKHPFCAENSRTNAGR